MSTQDKLTIKYHGGLASEGRLNFYEYSRAAYSISRIVLTIDHYRRTGIVPYKITKDRVSAILIEAPRRGSFPIEMIIPVAASSISAGASALSMVPVSTILEYIIDSVLGRGRDSDHIEAVLKYVASRDANELARDRLNSEAQQRQMDLLEKQLDIIRDQIKNQNLNSVSPKDLASFLELARDAKIYFPPSVLPQAQRDRIIKTLRSEIRRDEDYERFSEQLDNDSSSLAELKTKLRSQIQDISVPLRSSATEVHIFANDNEKTSFNLNRNDIEALGERLIGEEILQATGNISRYDKILGFGLCHLFNTESKRIHFSIPPNRKKEMKDILSDALKEEVCEIFYRELRSPEGTLTSIQIHDVKTSR